MWNLLGLKALVKLSAWRNEPNFSLDSEENQFILPVPEMADKRSKLRTWTSYATKSLTFPTGLGCSES